MPSMRFDTWMEEPPELRRPSRKRKVSEQPSRQPPEVQSQSASSEMCRMQQEIVDVKECLVSVQAMVTENANLLRSVLLTVQNSAARVASTSSQGSGVLSSPNAGRGSTSSFRMRSTAVGDSKGSLSLSEPPGYSSMVEDLAKIGSIFRVSRSTISSHSVTS